MRQKAPNEELGYRNSGYNRALGEKGGLSFHALNMRGKRQPNRIHMHKTHHADANDVCEQRPRVLICEDDPILACDLELQLEDLGFEPIGPFATQADAIRALRSAVPEAAVIDVELADGACTRLAGILRDKGVLTIVVSGLRVSSPPPEFAGATWLLKPLPYDALARQLERVTGRKEPSPTFAPVTESQTRAAAE